MAIDRTKLKTMDKLKDKGFDTASKIKTLDGRLILKNGLTGEMANIFDLQDAIKANHSELAWLMDGEDPKPERKEAADADELSDETIFPIMINYLEECIDNVQYKDTVETTIYVNKDSNGIWQISEDEMYAIDDLLLPGI